MSLPSSRATAVRATALLATLATLATLALVASCTSAPAQEAAPGIETGAAIDFDALFTGRTLRFDYHHTGDADEEHVAPDVLRLEAEWPGSRTKLLDDTNLGKYLFAVVDPETNRTVYSRGFASIYGEWETTGEARTTWRSFHESQRFPEPRRPVQLVLKKRGDDGLFHEIFSMRVDPKSRFVDRSPLAVAGQLLTLHRGGPIESSVDLLFVGEGYTAEQKDAFVEDVRGLLEVFWETEPYRSRKMDFNVRALQVPSVEPGISNPRAGVWRNTPLGLSFNAFDSDRYVLTYANKALREATARAPYDALVLLFNDRKYGGGGIFNLWATNAAGSNQADYLFIHEFGHSFAGLADEYYTSQVSYEEPSAPNVTALLDPENLKWGDLVAEDTPIPTPWDQDAYDEASYAYQEKRAALRAEGASEERMEELFAEVAAITGPMLRSEEHFGRIGAFEGAAYRAKGLYRSEADCIMFTRNPSSYCRVCTRAIERVIDLYAD